MSEQLINHSPDLKDLREDGYEVEIIAGHLVIHNVPYVDSNKQVQRGKLVSILDVAGEVTIKPKTHVAMFAGEYPHYKDGRRIAKIEHTALNQTIREDVVIAHSFSSKPAGGSGYANYYDKMTAYIAIISNQAEAIDPSATAQTRRIVETNDDDAIFKYTDTASGRAGISELSAKLELCKIAIIGLGGTGSYILDLIVKTHVRKIHLFDDDYFLQHNAFRSPGAPSVAELKKTPKKVHYWADRYAPMRNNIIAHDIRIKGSNLDELNGMNFVFIAVDRGDIKLPIIEKLEALDIPFIDVGMGIALEDGHLDGIIRVTTSTPQQRTHVRSKKRICFSGGEPDGIYSHNIQIADLNALNATLAVIRWKKHFGFYSDFEGEHFTAYTLDGNTIINEDKVKK
jgi:hypothetical protein